MEAEFISHPHRVVDKLFEEKLRAGGSLDQFESQIEKKFLEAFSNDHLLDSIPSLSDVHFESLPNGSLVRFRAMVQDMFEPEYFPLLYQAGKQSKCGLFRDSFDVQEGEVIDFNSASAKTSCRHSLLCIPIPAETTWAQTQYHNKYLAAGKQAQESSSEGERANLKRRHEEEEEPASSVAMDVSPKKPTTERRTKGEDAKSSPSQAQKTVGVPLVNPQFHPLPNEPRGFACLIKVYGEEHSLKLNEEIEFFGILNYETASSESASLERGVDDVMADPFEEEFLQQQALFSKVPRLHVISSKKIENNNNPLLPRSLVGSNPPVADRVFNDNLSTLRNQLLQYIGDFLEGDVVAAEFLLLNLISSVYLRQDDLCLGKFSLNLSNCPGSGSAPRRAPTPPSILGNRSSRSGEVGADGSDAGAGPKKNEWIEKVAQMISSLVPKFHKISLSLDYLNTSKFSPSKDYQTHLLKSAELQLTEGTVLLLDETAMKEGKLIDQGVKNLQAIHQLIQSQTLQYDFQYYPLKFHTNVPVVIFSEGKSLIPVDFWVPLEPLKLPVPVVPPAFSEEFMNTFRSFISLLRVRQYEIAPEMAQEVEQGFAKQRQQAHITGEAKMTQEELSSQLSLARLLAISFGESGLSSKRWTYAQELEAVRRTRTAKYQKATPEPVKF